MLRTFNMGIGLALVVAEQDLARVTTALKKKREKFWIIGRIVRGRPGVKYLAS
jgi:phosphoribosylformylglycinamidine cyclo-ligase